MWGWYTPTLFYATPPPLSLGQKLSGSLGHEKHPEFGPSNRLRKPRCPERRIVVNRDSFRKLRRRNAASKPPFPERGIVRPGPRRQGIGFASLRALDCSGPSLGDSLFMRERGELQRRGSPPGPGLHKERFCNPTDPDGLSRG